MATTITINSNSVRYVNECGYITRNSRLMDGMCMYFSNEKEDEIGTVSSSVCFNDEDIDAIDWDAFYLKSDPYAECNYGNDD